MFSQWIDKQLNKMFPKNYTKAEAAKMFGISRQTLHSWLNGQTYPSIARIPILLDIITEKTNQDYETLEIEIVLSIIKKTR
jgi:transcriptional regulator with XRE-family HTH domain